MYDNKRTVFVGNLPFDIKVIFTCHLAFSMVAFTASFFSQVIEHLLVEFLQDEEIYRLFASISNLGSSIEAVRVVRDPHSSLGKGIAYVLFKTRVWNP